MTDHNIAKTEFGPGPLPTDPAARKSVPLATGVLDYFPDALAEVARVSKVGNDQHNPGQPLHWDKTKSMDHADCIVRHLLERGTTDTDGMRHSAKVAWRALALLQIELEAEVRDVVPPPEDKLPLLGQLDDTPGETIFAPYQQDLRPGAGFVVRSPA